jgi:exodeoxyribonuclease V beta subunit
MSGLRYPMPPALAAMPQGRHQAIEASAGTGKTFLIEHRIADLIIRGGASLDHILVVTFTEKATAELRARVRALLARVAAGQADAEEPCWHLDEAAATRLRHALTSFDRAAIFTIHGFCQRVLLENAFGSRRLFEQVQVPGEAAFAEAFRDALREVLARDAGPRRYLEAWLDRREYKPVEGLEELLHQCAEALGDAPVSTLEPPYDPDALARALGAAAALIDGGPEAPWRAALAGAIKHGGSRKAVVGRLESLAEILARFRADGDELAALCALDQKDPPYQLLVDRLPPDHPVLGPIHAAMVALSEAAVPLVAALAAEFLPEILARLHRNKDERGQFDFHDMLRLVWRALESEAGAELAGRLRRRYPHALIDEFQDTDELQWSIFRRLYLEGAGGTLAVIGDPKQAIYAFRGADVHTYVRARRELLAAGAQPTALLDNHRSTPAMVAAYNEILAGARFPEPFFAGGITYDPPVRAAAQVEAVDARGAAVAPVRLLEVDAGGEAADELLRAHLTAEIVALLGDPDRALTVRAGGQERRVGAGDIFVLTRKTREAEDVAAALRQAGVPCALYRQEGLFRTDEAAEVRDLFAGIADPRDRSARLAAWQTRFFDVPLAELTAVADLPDSHPLLERLWVWKGLADRLDYERLFTRILSDSGILERQLITSGSTRTITNLEHLFELLEAEVLRSRCELSELVQRLQRWIDETEAPPADDRDVQRLEAHRDSVQIMTVHKAKGLEAAVVFLYGGLGRFSPPGSVRVYHDGDRRRVCIGRDQAVKQRVDAESEAEDRRLLYVALTRAKARMYLPLVHGKVAGYHRTLNERLAAIAGARAAEPELAARFAIDPVGPDTGRPRPAFDPAGWRPPAALLAPAAPAADYATVTRTRAGFAVTSYTRLKGHGRATDDLAADVDAIAARADRLPGGAGTGIFLHDLLETLPLEPLRELPALGAWAALPEVDRQLRAAMLRHDQDPRHLAEVAAMVHGALTTALAAGDAAVGPVAAADRVLREAEFLYPIPEAPERGFVKGYIDVTLEHDGRLYLIDWKSDLLPDYQPATLAAHVADNYERQARLYAIAAARMLGAATADDYRRRFGGMLFCFLRGPGGCGVHHVLPSFAALEATGAELAAREEL